MTIRMKPIPPRPDLTERLRKSIAEFESLPPEKQAELRRVQRKSWVVGELMLSHPDWTREQAEALYDEVEAGTR